MSAFISFSSLDRKIAEKIYDRLKASGVDSWISSRDIPPGADYQACIVEAIERSKVVVLVFSSRANASQEIAKELSLASRKILIPVRIEDVVPQGSFQYQLSNRQFIDLFEDFDRKLDELVERIRAVAASGTVSAPPPPVNRQRKGSFPMAAGVGGVVVAIAAGAALWMHRAPDPGTAATKSAASSNTADVRTASAAMPLQPAPRKEQAAPVPAKAEAPPSVVAVSAQTSAAPSAPEAQAPAVPAAAMKNVLAMVGSTSNADRLSAIQAAERQLPDNMRAADAEELLRGANGYRASAIGLIARHLASLGGEDASRVLGDTSNSDRLTALQKLVDAGRLRGDLSSAEAEAVLNGTNGYRANAIQVLAQQLRAELAGADVARLLGQVSNSDRLSGIQTLVRANRVRRNLAPDEAARILDGTNGYRATAIDILSPFVAGKLNGAAAATVLGPTSNSDRLAGISSLVRNGRLADNLQAADIDALLQNIGGYRTDALRILSTVMR